VSRLRDLGRFLWDFVVGDDPWVAAGVVAGLGLTALAAEAGDDAYLLLPVLVVVLLAWSLWRALPQR
jgi:hypothetical protein